MNNASSFFNLALYEAMTKKDDTSRKENTKKGNRETGKSVNTDVRRKETTSSKKKPSKARTPKKTSKEGREDLVLVLESELKGDK